MVKEIVDSQFHCSQIIMWTSRGKVVNIVAVLVLLFFLLYMKVILRYFRNTINDTFSFHTDVRVYLLKKKKIYNFTILSEQKNGEPSCRGSVKM